MMPSLGEIAHGTVSAQLAALLEHEAGARHGEDIEAVHQMRVATRRLRAALKTFAAVVPADAGVLRAELAWLADALGAVRDLDVQMAAIRAEADACDAPPLALAAVLRWFDARHAACRRELVDALESTRHTALLGAVETVVAHAPADWPGAAREPAEQAMPDLLRSRYRRFRKATQGLDGTSAPADLHRARIRTKQLRYSLEPVRGLYGNPVRALIRHAVELQDVLGKIQDSVEMDKRLRLLCLSGSELPPSGVFLAGQLAARFAHQASLAREQVPGVRRRVTRRGWRRLKRRFA